MLCDSLTPSMPYYLYSSGSGQLFVNYNNKTSNIKLIYFIER